MVDSPNGIDPAATPPEQKPASPVSAFLASSTGKLIVGGALLAVVLVAVGALAFFFLLSPSDDVIAPIPAAGGQAAVTETVEPTNPPEQPLDETFTFRNVFAPTVSPPTAKSDENDGGSEDTSESANAPENTLVLKSIRTESGERVATFEWNGNVYDCSEGDRVDDSPWEVVTIYSDSVVMLYGDSRITLTVGQGFGDGGVISK